MPRARAKKSRTKRFAWLGYAGWLFCLIPLVGLVIILDLIGSHVIGYGRQKIEILSVQYTGQRKVPYRLNYLKSDGTKGHMAWPHNAPGQELCQRGMLVDAVVNLSAGTVDVSTCAFPDSPREKP